MALKSIQIDEVLIQTRVALATIVWMKTLTFEPNQWVRAMGVASPPEGELTVLVFKGLLIDHAFVSTTLSALDPRIDPRTG